MNFIVHFIYGIILPIDELIFFKMVKTTNQYNMWDFTINNKDVMVL